MRTALPRVTIRELGHVALFVRDLEATRRFYRDILGLAETGIGKEAHGLTPFGETPTSFSVRDPDDHEVELYVATTR